MADTKEPILVQLVKEGIDIDSLGKEGPFYDPVVDLIRRSPVICEMAKQPWEFKSLAQYGIEEFCWYSISLWTEPNPNRRLPTRKSRFTEQLSYFQNECVNGLVGSMKG